MSKQKEPEVMDKEELTTKVKELDARLKKLEK